MLRLELWQNDRTGGDGPTEYSGNQVKHPTSPGTGRQMVIRAERRGHIRASGCKSGAKRADVQPVAAQSPTRPNNLSMNIRPLVNKVFTRKYQFSLQPTAVDLIEEIFSEHEIAPGEVQNALELMAKECQRQEGKY